MIFYIMIVLKNNIKHSYVQMFHPFQREYRQLPFMVDSYIKNKSFSLEFCLFIFQVSEQWWAVGCNGWLWCCKRIILIRVLFGYLSMCSKQLGTIDSMIENPIRNESRKAYFCSNKRRLLKTDTSTCPNVW